MDPFDPLDAQQVVAEYARVLERDVSENRHPARLDALPYAKPIIKTAIETSTRTLAASQQLTDELREFLESAYTLLSEYIEPELVELMSEYRRAAEDLTVEAQAKEKTQTAAWRKLTESSLLMGELARAMTTESEALRTEFRTLIASAS